MAASSSSMAASKLLNLRTAALQSLVRGHLRRPSAASAHLVQSTTASPTPPDAQALPLFHLENRSTESVNQSPNAINLNLLLNSQLTFGPSAMQIEARRTYVPNAGKDDAFEDFDDDDNDDDDDDDDDDGDFDADIQNYRGSDDDDDDDVGFDDDYDGVDEDPDTRPRGGGRRYRN